MQKVENHNMILAVKSHGYGHLEITETKQTYLKQNLVAVIVLCFATGAADGGIGWKVKRH